MLVMDGEITEVTAPPNKADQFRSVTIWVPDTEDHLEFTFFLTEYQKAGLEVGDKITIKLEKKFDIDALTQDLLKGPE